MWNPCDLLSIASGKIPEVCGTDTVAIKLHRLYLCNVDQRLPGVLNLNDSFNDGALDSYFVPQYQSSQLHRVPWEPVDDFLP